MGISGLFPARFFPSGVFAGMFYHGQAAFTAEIIVQSAEDENGIFDVLKLAVTVEIGTIDLYAIVKVALINVS